MKNTLKLGLFLFVLVLFITPASALVWNTNKFAWSNDQKSIIITDGESATFSTGAFVSDSDTVKLVVDLLSKDGMYVKNIATKDIDVTEFTGFEKITISHEDYHSKGTGDYIVKVTLSDSFPDSKTDFLKLTIKENTLPQKNTAPTIVITAPANDASFKENTPVTFKATATDAEDGDISSKIEWSGTPNIAKGASTTQYLSPKKYVVTAKVTDSQGLVSSATITVSASQNGPALWNIIVSPQNAVSTIGDKISYTAKAAYSDGTLVDITLFASWASTDDKIASMNANIATAKSIGKTTIKATYGEATGITSLSVKEKQELPITITKILVAPKETDVFVGDKITYTATAIYSDNSQKDITNTAIWTVQYSDVASINKNIATAKKIGATDVIATLNSVKGYASLSVLGKKNEAPIVTITNPQGEEYTVPEGTVISFSAKAIDAENGDVSNTIKWAEFGTGEFGYGPQTTHSFSIGSHVILAIAKDSLGISGTDKIIIHVAEKAKPFFLDITPKDKTVFVDETVQYTATLTFTDGSKQDVSQSATWKSSAQAVAEMDKNIASAKTIGDTTITASANGLTAKTSLSVIEKPSSKPVLQTISLSPQHAVVFIEKDSSEVVSVSYTAIGHYSDGSTKDITQEAAWKNKDIIPGGNTNLPFVLMQNNIAIAKNTGVTLIQASFSGLTGQTDLTVASKIVEMITLQPKDIETKVGDKTTYTVTAHYSDGSIKDVTHSTFFTSTNSVVASMNNNIATSLSKGTTKIQATVTLPYGIKKAETSLTVLQNEETKVPTALEVIPKDATIQVEEKLTYTALLHFSDNSKEDVTSHTTWTSTDTTIASINKNIVTGKSEGTTKIQAGYAGINGQASLTVLQNKPPKTPSSLEIIPKDATIQVGEKLTYTALLHFSDNSKEDVTSHTTWTSTDTTIASINKNIATSLSEGTTKITANYKNFAAIGTLTVKKSIQTDITAPKIDWESPKDNEVLTMTNVPVSFSVEDDTALQSCSLRIEKSTGETDTLEFNVKNEKTHSEKFILSLPQDMTGLFTATITCTDLANNLKEETRNFTIVQTPEIPVLSVKIVNPENGKTYSSPTVPVEIISSDVAAKISYKIDNGAFKEYILKTTETLTVGTHTIIAKAENEKESVESSATFTIIEDAVVDVTAPVITLISPKQNEEISKNPVEFIFDVSDDTTVEECKIFIDNIPQVISVQKSSAEIKISEALSEGTHTWLVICVDKTGKSTTTEPISFKIVPPSTSQPKNNVNSEKEFFIKKIAYDSSVQAGDIVTFTLTFKNTGINNLANVKVKASILDLGIYATNGPFDIKAGQEISKKVTLEIPDDASADEYDVRFTVTSQGITRVLHRTLTIEN